MDMFSPSTNEYLFKQISEAAAFASSVLADESERRAQSELVALGDRVSAARLVI